MIAYLQPSRALLEAGLTDVVLEASSPDIPVDEDFPSLHILGSICKLKIYLVMS